MFQYQEKVNAGVPQLCTKEKWDELIDSPAVTNICKRIAGLDEKAADYAERKQALKKRLPVIIPHAASFKNGKRVSADAVASGLAMLDVDHVENPKEWFDSIDKQLLSDNRIYLVAITASGKGLRVIGKRKESESIEAAQLRIAQLLGIQEYDAVTKDLARASYVVPREYILWIDEEGMFEEPKYDFGTMNKEEIPASDAGLTDGEKPDTIRQNERSLLALPPHTEDEESLTYKGIPYKSIIDQLMISIGNAGGAEVGERNTVYFSLSTYMRYITDFNVELLLRILPDFGLSESERRQTIASSLGRPRKSEMPMVLQSAIALCEREMANDKSPMSNLKSTDLPLPELPKLLRVLCKRLPAEYRPAMVIASLPVLGTLATGIRFHYLDMQEQSLSFFSCITAPAASGKSFIRKPLDLLLTPINEQDAIEREKEQAYKEKLRASKNSKASVQGETPCQQEQQEPTRRSARLSAQ